MKNRHAWQPDALTISLSSGLSLGEIETDWLQSQLATLKNCDPSDKRLSLGYLKRTYMVARILQGAIVSSRQALPMAIAAGEAIRSGLFQARFDELARKGETQTERFITGSIQGRPRQGNDYPQVAKSFVSALAALQLEPSELAFRQMEADDPCLIKLAQDADELQRICWAHLRWRINEVLTEEEISEYRSRPLSLGTDALLELVAKRIGSPVPARVMQRDDWRDALEKPRQDAPVAVFNATKYFVEVAEIASLYYIGTTLIRMQKRGDCRVVLNEQIEFAAQEIAAGTEKVTHNARFQSRVGARPNDYRSFKTFLSSVQRQLQFASIAEGGELTWQETSTERGWCPVQNQFSKETSNYNSPEVLKLNKKDLAELGRIELDLWRTYAYSKFGVTPKLERRNPATLFGCVVLFAALERVELLPGSSFLECLLHEIGNEDTYESQRSYN